MRRTRSGFKFAQSPVIKKVEWTWCLARISSMLEVGVDGPPASNVKAIRCLPVFPISISTGDTRCTPGGVSQGPNVGVGRGGCVGVGVGFGTEVGVGVGIAVGIDVGVGAGVGYAVAVGRGVGVPP